jgi:hypothetical protein
MVYGEVGRVNVHLHGLGRSWAYQCLLTQSGEGERVYVGLHGVRRRCACLCWPAWCMGKVSLSMLASWCCGEVGLLYLHGACRRWACLF